MWTEAPTERALSKKILESAKDDGKWFSPYSFEIFIWVDFDEAQDKLFSQWRDSSDHSSIDEDDDDDDDDDDDE